MYRFRILLDDIRTKDTISIQEAASIIRAYNIECARAISRQYVPRNATKREIKVYENLAKEVLDILVQEKTLLIGCGVYIRNKEKYCKECNQLLK